MTIIIFKLILTLYVFLVTCFFKNIIEEGCSNNDISYILGVTFSIVFNFIIIICIWKLKI